MPVAESTGALSASIPHLAGAWLYAGPAEFTCAVLGAARPRHPPASKTHGRIPKRQLRASASPVSRPTLRGRTRRRTATRLCCDVDRCPDNPGRAMAIFVRCIDNTLAADV